jgi:F-type H+-transporting ATPase subunit delta
MGSASRAALEAAKKDLASAKGVTLTTGEQLLSAGRDIAGSKQLRALLADPSIEPAE